MTDTAPTTGVTPVRWIAMRAALDDEFAPLVDAAADPRALVTALLDAAAYPAAIRAVAAALPLREGVWWAWVSARHAAQGVHGETVPEPLARTLARVEAWVGDPSDANRRSAWDAANALGLDTAAGAAGVAAYMAGGSVAAADGPVVPPPPGVSGTLVGAAVTIAAVGGDPAAIAERARHYVQQGLVIVDKLGGWEAAIRRTWDALDAQHRAHVAAATPPATGAAS